MKRITLLSFAVSLSSILMAGGIVTNTNQSAMFTRLQARDATIGIDAVYFNPAGLNFLPNNGLYFSLNNQTLGQTRTITSDYLYLNNSEYLGKVSAPLFPGIYAAYKMDKFAFSVGFNPIGGGGGGIYEDGLPSFEYSVSDLVPALASQGATDYRMDVNFEGSSVFFGYQANFSYLVNDMISVAVGCRYVSAKETYKGYLRDVELNMGGTWMRADAVMTGIATSAYGGGTAMQPLIDEGVGGYTFAQAQGGGAITADQRAQMEGGLLALGIPQAQIDVLTLAQAQGAYNQAGAKYTATATILGDQEADMEKTAAGFTPIVSVNIHPSEKLNIALKYEHQTTLEFENNTTKDFTTGFDPATGAPVTMFPDGKKARYDIPSQIVVGATFKPIDKLLLSTGFHYYLDKNADWEGRQDSLDGNSIEFALGAEYSLTEKLLVSAGYLYTKSGATESYQTDLSYSLPSSSIGGGFAYKVTPMIELNLAGSYTMYQEGERNFSHDFAGSGTLLPVKETYIKPIWIVAVGLNINFGAGK
jgi:long-subunit fatty acid transport protein